MIPNEKRAWWLNAIGGFPVPDPNWLMIRPSQAHTRVFPDRNYRVWTSALQSEPWSGDGVIRNPSVWKVWTMVWRWSDQRSIWSEKFDQRPIRAHLGLITVWLRPGLNWSEWSEFESGPWFDKLLNIVFWSGQGVVETETNSVWSIPCVSKV